ncbi:tRNA (adenosine(37)-N6)-threonylcarbamoyltransferase complex dimerization subunit type 1 TsaB [Corynebacterium sp. CCUG 69979]|uniref:tRNA (adenosine(37)-N6)-threonylcarbamoyltransferase complex dimerization subunit type 1 TsaB n=1 Tax=Corynebacterium sp. CCUG 69979 TaxID=2823890 RepID=UPI0021099EC3|nr:tRNA (adenosine(37)-N6)-threonylcarbamoyltransferase complex dimerization subunit type 1 TsaB [Corynebacterium sp. CCUG 69979]MCQ4624115.1 tRNA (adenosine(37)-N6)-threonylcarbamoyltransferase complex dimerization subunit type 1 TsaB [Corynebacterium sp. CCUG 69979]
MNVLAIDTATTDLVAGIVDTDTGGDARVLAEAVTETRAHNELLVPTVMELLSQAGLEFSDLDAVVVGCGPGPFTGLRVGMSTASAFGQALGIPVHGVCTHDAVAALARQEHGEGSSLIVTDARRREVYWARYEAARRVAGPDVVAPAALNVARADVISCPESLRGQLPAELIGAARHITYIPPHPAGLVAVADLAATPEPLVPLYLRRPDAKEPAPKPKSPAIPDVDV